MDNSNAVTKRKNKRLLVSSFRNLCREKENYNERLNRQRQNDERSPLLTLYKNDVSN